MTISVVMATYNGRKYIKEQLESIRCQLRTPDEVLIFDDKSEDGTDEIVEKFIKEYNLSKTWKLYRNDQNRGWQRNFFNGVRTAKGDIIFFSDQDDVWLSTKIEHMAKIMEEKTVGCVYCGYEFIDANGCIVPGAECRKNVAKANSIDRFNTVVTMGCRMCISREIANAFLAINVPDYSYDSQCGRLAILYSQIEIVPEIGIKYRIHANNTSNVDGVVEAGCSNLKERIIEIEEDEQWLKKLLEYDKDYNDGIHELLIKEVTVFQQHRLNYLKKKRGIRLLSTEARYYRDISMMIGDFAYRHGLNKAFGKIAMFIRRKRLCHH